MCTRPHSLLIESLTADAYFRYLFHNTNHHVTEGVESVYNTCSSGRDKISIQACSKSGDILCGGGSEPGERLADGRAGSSGDIMMLLLLDTKVSSTGNVSASSCRHSSSDMESLFSSVKLTFCNKGSGTCC